MNTSAIILAAGDGKRMKSAKPKVLMEVLSEPMLGWVLDSAEKAGVENIGIIAGKGAEPVRAYLEKRGTYKTYLQAERRGTAHAVMQAEELYSRSDCVLVLNGDGPFVDAETIAASLEFHKKNGNSVTVITAEIDDPAGYGRIVRGADGELEAIVEQKDCNDEQKKIREVNSGAYWFDGKALTAALPKVTPMNASGELYLTDTVSIIRGCGGKAGAYNAPNPDIVLGANSRKDLLELNTKARMAVIGKHLDNGVEFPCTDGIIIGKDVVIGQDTVILPNTIIGGKTVIGKNCVIGPNSFIENCNIGDDNHLNNVQAFDSVTDSSVKAGPFVQLRPGTRIHEGVKIGDFVELKNAEIGVNTCVAHLTYLGDCTVGRGVNFGCGCVTANYDGINKYHTNIGDYAFIGCNTNLIAPVNVGENATTGAGSTITRDVPADSLAVERAEINVIENWEKNKQHKKK